MAFRREEEEFKQRMLAKFAEDDRLEQMNAQKRRMRLADHQREVQRLIEDKRKAFEEAKSREEAEDAAKWVQLCAGCAKLRLAQQEGEGCLSGCILTWMSSVTSRRVRLHVGYMEALLSRWHDGQRCVVVYVLLLRLVRWLH